MHSSRMRTARSSSCPAGGVSTRHPPRSRQPPTRHPFRLDTPWEQAPQARTRPPPEQAPLQTRHPPEQVPPRPGTPWDQTPPCGQTHTCKHITLAQTSFAGGKNLNGTKFSKGIRPKLRHFNCFRQDRRRTLLEKKNNFIPSI